MAGARVHPTAIVSPEASLADGVEVGPFVVIDGPARIGAGTRLAPHVHLLGDVRIGRDNEVGTGAVIGGLPQDRKFDPAIPSGVRIGDRNLIREHVTIHRASSAGGLTEIGDDAFLMVGSHVAHDCRVGDGVMLANAVLLGGHVEIEDRAVLAGGVAVHQFVRVGRLAMIGGFSATGKDVPPYMMANWRSLVTGLNVVGLRRAPELTPAARRAIREAYRTLYRSGLPFGEALDRIAQDEPIPEVRHLVDFCRASQRGICRHGRFDQEEEGGQVAP